MRFDVISVFPEFFDVLNLSLVGKARDRGLFSVHVHDLRDWTHDVHRTVDDAPFGGGAGMVMKPDVWAEAIDAVTENSAASVANAVAASAAENTAAENTAGLAAALAPSTAALAPSAEPSGENVQPIVLAIPTPSGIPLRQATCEQLARTASRIVIACGRYEGIDVRVAQYYERQAGVQVLEYSLGDYVLNGGEIAAVALIEAVTRLLPGMVGNPESLAEESHGADGLLEYPAFTHPADFRGLTVPEVLRSGNHGAVARWRKNEAIARTASRRPDILRKLATSKLDKHDRAALAAHWYFAERLPDRSFAPTLTQMQIRKAQPTEAQAISELAARTFPDAAPSYLRAADVQAFISQELQPQNFAQLLADPRHNMLVVVERCDSGGAPTGELVGYTWTIIPDGAGVAGAEQGAPVDFVTADGVARSGPLMYLEKVYLDRPWRGSGMMKQLMDVTLRELRALLRERAQVPASLITETQVPASPSASPVPAAPYLWLGTNHANKRAQRAYARYGFEVSGTREFYVGEQLNNDLTMALRLDMAQ